MGIIMLLLPDNIGSNSVVGIVGDIVFDGFVSGVVVGELRMIFGGQV